MMRAVLNFMLCAVTAVVAFSFALIIGVAAEALGADKFDTGMIFGIALVCFWPAVIWLVDRYEELDA